MVLYGRTTVGLNVSYCGSRHARGRHNTASPRGQLPWYVAHAILENTIIAFSTSGEAVYCGTGSTATLACCDVYGNAGGDWVGYIAGQEGVNGNFSADPLFCDSGNGDYRLQPCSPCLDAAGCGLVGACGAGDETNRGMR